MSEAKSCANCAYKFRPEWMADPAYERHYQEKAECHRHAPVTAVDSEGNDLSGWPVVLLTDFCGDFAENPND